MTQTNLGQVSLSPNLIRNHLNRHVSRFILDILCYFNYLKSVFIQNKCVFNKYKSCIIFFYYIILYFTVLIFYFIFLVFLILFILFIYFILLFYFINIILYYYIIFLYLYQMHLLNRFLYKKNLKYFFEYSFLIQLISTMHK